MKFVFSISGWHLGGIVTFCRNLSAGLRNRGHEVALLLIHHDGAHSPVPNGLFDQCVVLTRGISRTRSFVDKVASEINRLNPDIIVLNASPYAMAALPYIHRKILRIPVIHVPAEADLAFSNQQWWDRALTVSEFVSNSLKAEHFCERVSVCPLGVPLASTTRQDRYRGKSPLQIVSASRIVVPQKRMERLPVIAQLLTELRVEYHWTILGDGEYLRELRQEVNRLRLTDKFSFRGSVCESIVSQTFGESDVFVMVSDYEGLPQALLEAMARGVVPVVSRINGSTTCAIEDRISGYLCEPSVAVEFAKAVAELARNPSLHDFMGLRAAERVARYFSLDSFTERFLTVVNGCRSFETMRPKSLCLTKESNFKTPFECLGFWGSLRNQVLGRLKRSLLRKTYGSRASEGSGPPPSF